LSSKASERVERAARAYLPVLRRKVLDLPSVYKRKYADRLKRALYLIDIIRGGGEKEETIEFKAFQYIAQRPERLLEVTTSDIGPLRLFSDALMHTEIAEQVVDDIVSASGDMKRVDSLFSGSGYESVRIAKEIGVGVRGVSEDVISLEMLVENAYRFRVKAEALQLSVERIPEVDNLIVLLSPYTWILSPEKILTIIAKRAKAPFRVVGLLPVRSGITEPSPLEPYLALVGVLKTLTSDKLKRLLDNLFSDATIDFKTLAPFAFFTVEIT